MSESLPPRRAFSVSRREFLGALGGVAAGAGLGSVAADSGPATAASASRTEPFYGVHQGGIVTPAQTHTAFATFDVTTERRRDLADLLAAWTALGARLAGGLSSSSADGGEAAGLGPARLTVNFGFGPGLFGVGGPDRFGLAALRPMELIDLPAFAHDDLAESTTGGDLSVHACADDPQVVFHAVRQLAREAAGVASIRWTQSGFNETAASAGTPRNLLGFKDGTVNPKSAAELAGSVWVGEEGPGWMTGGTYLVIRRIQLALDDWDRQSVDAQEQIIGRRKISGAPLGGSHEFDPMNLHAKRTDGAPVIPTDAHVRLASAQENWGYTMLRRGYAYTDGLTATATDAAGETPLRAGLLFSAYQRSPRLTFIPIFEKLAGQDSLSRFTTHTASAIMALPPAAGRPGTSVGQQLLDA